MSKSIYLDDPYLDQIWAKVGVLRQRLFQAEIDAGYTFKKTAWQNMSPDEKRLTALEAVEETIIFQMKSLIQEENDDGSGQHRNALFIYPCFRTAENVRFKPFVGIVPVKRPEIFAKTTFTRSKVKYAQIMLTLDKIRTLLKSGTVATKRELYYQNINEYGSQYSLDSCVIIISAMLQIPRAQLRIFSTAKGLVSGNIRYLLNDGTEVDCSMGSNGELMPQDVAEISGFATTSKMVLLIEKDATFQKLIQDPAMMANSVLITAKGMPDLNTRQFLCRLWNELKLPIFGIFDADPFGLEIMLVYRFGSRVMAWCAEPLAVPQMKWLGVHPSDFEHLDKSLMKELSEVDYSKLRSIMGRNYVQSDARLMEELRILQSTGYKSEIQNIDLLSIYILDKLDKGQWI